MGSGSRGARLSVRRIKAGLVRTEKGKIRKKTDVERNKEVQLGKLLEKKRIEAKRQPFLEAQIIHEKEIANVILELKNTAESIQEIEIHMGLPRNRSNQGTMNKMNRELQVYLSKQKQLTAKKEDLEKKIKDIKYALSTIK